MKIDPYKSKERYWNGRKRQKREFLISARKILR